MSTDHALGTDLPRSTVDSRSPWTRRIVILFILGLVIAGAAGAVVHQREAAAHAAAEKKPKVAPAVTLTAATATRGSLGVHLWAIGTVSPVYTGSITSQVTGVITQIHYREGQQVQKGDPLIDIDSRVFDAQLEQARGTLDKDTKVLAQAKMDLERYKAAWARNAIQKQTLDDQEQIVLQDEGVVKADEGTVHYDETEVAFCHIKAPFTGRVGLRLVDPGNIVQANSSAPLVVVTQEDPITVIFTLAEDFIHEVDQELRDGKSLEVAAFDRTENHLLATGVVLTLDNQVDPTTGTVRVRARFENGSHALFPNQFVNARLLVKTIDGLTLIPTTSIQHNGPETFVYVLANGTAEMRKVTQGPSDQGMSGVEGVNPGEVVASSSFEKLHPNANVKIVEAHASAEAGAAATAPAAGDGGAAEGRP